MATLKAASNVDIYNTARATLSPEIQQRLPAGTLANMAEIGNMITSQEFQGSFNAWQHALFNRIGMTLFYDYVLENPLAKYIYGTMDWGDAIEVISTDIVKGSAMDYGKEGQSIDPFIKMSNEAKAEYHKVENPIQYGTTIERDRIRRAFLREGGLTTLINMFINKLMSSANVDTWLQTKLVIADYVNGVGSSLALAPNQNVTVTPVTDETSAKRFILGVKNVMSAMRFPNNAFNAQRIHKTLNNNNLTLFARADVVNTIGVEALATAFNIDQLNLNVEIELMDDFGVDKNSKPTNDVVAVLAEDWWLLITQQFNEMESIYNPRGRYWNYFLTRQMSFGTTYFKDAVIFRTAP